MYKKLKTFKFKFTKVTLSHVRKTAIFFIKLEEEKIVKFAFQKKKMHFFHSPTETDVFRNNFSASLN